MLHGRSGHAWLDRRRWKWLVEQFDDIAPDQPTILPTSEFFPDRYDRSDDAVRRLLERVCDYMHVPADAVELSFYRNERRFEIVNESGKAIGDAAGTYQERDGRFHIRIERSQFHRPMELVGTVAHELAHVRLLGEGRLDRNEFDNELLTDLTVVFHGMGIFLANVPRAWPSRVGSWPDTDVPKPEYMSTPMYGYALALRSRLMDEPCPPSWKRHLHAGVRAEFKQALRFLVDEERKRETTA